MVERSKVRVLIAKPGLDGHDRGGAKVIARASGMRVLRSSTPASGRLRSR